MNSYPGVIRVATLPNPPFVYPCGAELGKLPNKLEMPPPPYIRWKKPSCRHPGSEIEFLAAIALILNVTIEITRPTNGKFDGPGGIVDKVHTGVVNMSTRNLFFNHQREKLVTFGDPQPFQYAFAVKTPSDVVVEYFSLTTPFASTVWYCCIAAALFACAAVFLTNFLYSCKTLQALESTGNIVFSWDSTRLRLSQVVLFIFIIIPVAVIMTQYTSELIKALVPKTSFRKPFNNWKELKPLVDSGKMKPICHFMDTIKKVYEEKLGEQVPANSDAYVVQPDIPKIYQTIQTSTEQNWFTWLSEFNVRYNTKRSCDKIMVIYDESETYWMSFGFTPNSTLPTMFAEIIRSQNNIAYDLYERYLVYGANTCGIAVAQAYPFRIANIKEALMILAAGLCMATLGLIIEVCWSVAAQNDKKGGTFSTNATHTCNLTQKSSIWSWNTQY